MSVRRGDEDYESERRQSFVDEDRENHWSCPTPNCGFSSPSEDEFIYHQCPDGDEE